MLWRRKVFLELAFKYQHFFSPRYLCGEMRRWKGECIFQQFEEKKNSRALNINQMIGFAYCEQTDYQRKLFRH